jgi:hypothetical protein
MRQHQVGLAMERLAELKSTEDLRIIDSHVHPRDVLGVIDNQAALPPESNPHDPGRLKPGMVDRFYAGALERAVVDKLVGWFPGLFARAVEAAFQNSSLVSILARMDAALLDQIVLLPIDPWLSSNQVGEDYAGQDRLILLGSVDPHGVRLDQIESVIDGLIERYGIIGLKLHPNLQNFMPQPWDNPQPLAEKLDRIYSCAVQKELYLLFHGGSSSYPGPAHQAYSGLSRASDNGALSNFASQDGSSKLLGCYDTPVVIAHLGSLGKPRPDFELLARLCGRYEQVYFDTALMPVEFIARALLDLPRQRIIYGSDGLYASPGHSLTAMYYAANQVAEGSRLVPLLRGLLAANYETMLACCRQVTPLVDPIAESNWKGFGL